MVRPSEPLVSRNFAIFLIAIAALILAVPFADRKAKVRTFTVDRLAFTLQPPMVVAILDFEGGGRFQCEITDCEPEKVAIGQDVEMTFRRAYTVNGIHNYVWKARPIRSAAPSENTEEAHG